jgi:hypothetical protein
MFKPRVTDRLKNDVLRGVQEERAVTWRNDNWIGHILRRNCNLRQVVERNSYAVSSANGSQLFEGSLVSSGARRVLEASPLFYLCCGLLPYRSFSVHYSLIIVSLNTECVLLLCLWIRTVAYNCVPEYGLSLIVMLLNKDCSLQLCPWIRNVSLCCVPGDGMCLINVPLNLECLIIVSLNMERALLLCRWIRILLLLCFWTRSGCYCCPWIRSVSYCVPEYG